MSDLDRERALTPEERVKDLALRQDCPHGLAVCTLLECEECCVDMVRAHGDDVRKECAEGRRDSGAAFSAEADPLCPACGCRVIVPDAHLTSTIEDSEGYRWHYRCVVDLLSSVRGLVAKAGLDVGRK